MINTLQTRPLVSNEVFIYFLFTSDTTWLGGWIAQNEKQYY